MKVPPTPPTEFILSDPSHVRTFEGSLWRVFRTEGPHAVAWNELRHYGPIPDMRFDPQPPPADTYPNIGIMYAATRPYTALGEAYHGDTLGSVSVGGIDLFHAAYRDILLDVRRVPSPSPLFAGTDGALAALHALMAAEGHRVCAVVVEPLVQAAAGILTHSADFLRGVRAACDAAGSLLVVDEVATGIGATGTMWAVEQAGVSPDLLALGKRVTGGYLALSAVLATDEVYSAFLGSPASARTFFHGHTYTANPLACAAALANLDLMRERGTVARAAAVGLALGAALEPLVALPGVRELRRLGTMTGLELLPVPGVERTGFEVCRRARERGVWVRPLGDTVVLMPPLAIGDDDLALLTGVVAECVREVCG